MSYHVPAPPPAGLVRRRPRLARVPLYPLASAPPLPPDLPLTPLPSPQRGSGRELLIGLVVVAALLAFLYWLSQQEDAPEPEPRSSVRKQSTAQMAKNLYRRLGERGGANEATMRSLAQLSKNA